MSHYEFALTELNELAKRLLRCEHVVRTTPEDCASAEANLRHFLQEDLNTFYNQLGSDRGRYTEPQYDKLRDSVLQLQHRRRELLDALPARGRIRGF